MGLQINRNVTALNVRRALRSNKAAADSRIETISSGLRVKRAATDASGLVISEGMRARMAGLAQNLRNSEQASDLLQVAEGSLAQVSRILLRLRELAIQASDGSYADRQRETLASEFNQGREAIDRIAQNTTYNDTILLAGFSSVATDQSTAATGVERVQVSGDLDGKTIVVADSTGRIFQVGPDARDEDRLEFSPADLRSSSDILGLTRESLNSQASARAAVGTLDRAIARIASERGRIGGLQNRLAVSLSSTETALENLNASDSTIQDADMARESTALSRAQILNQTSTAMLAQTFDASRLAPQLL